MKIKKVWLFLLTFSVILSFPGIVFAEIDDSILVLKLTEFTQAANEDPTLGAIHWIGSIVQESNSRYYEGMSVPQRLIFNGVSSTPGDTHALTFNVDATKASIHAYDFLTSWDNAIPAADSIAPGQNLLIDLFSDRCDPEFWSSTQSICNYIHSLGLYDEADLTALNMGSVGGDNVQQRANNYDTYFGISRTIKIWGTQAVSSASITFDGYTGSSGNESANYTLHWTSASDTVIIEMAGHLAVGVDPLNAGIGYGEGRGAADISGGPYHFKLSYLDGSSLGSQDNQIKGADILLTTVECDVTPASDSICAGFDATFIDHSRGGTTPYSWVWTKPPDPTVLSTDSILTISNVTLADSGEYRVIVTDASSLADTCYAYLTVHAQPVCSITGDSVVCEGFTTSFCAAPGMISYSWSGPGGFSANTQCTGQIGVAGYYQVIITDANGCIESCGRTLVVNLRPVVTSPDTVEYDLCDTATVCFDITLYDPDDGLNVSVNPPGQFNAFDSSICFFADKDTTYNFTIIATDTCGNSDTAYTVGIVSFNEPPVITAPDSVEFNLCDTATVCFAITLYDPDDGLNVTVNPPGQFNSLDSSICFFADKDTTYNFTIIATDSCGKADTTYTTAVVRLDDPPWITAPDTVTFNLCDPDTVCFQIGISDPDDHLVVDVLGPGWFETCQGYPGICFYAYTETTYHFTIIVTDSCGRADTAYTTVIVNMNVPPVITAPDTVTYNSCDTATVCFDITLYDPDDGLNVTVNAPGQYNPSDSSICFFADGDTTYDFTIIVTDTCGASDTAYTTAVISVKLPELICSGDTLTCDSTMASAKVISDPSIGVSYFWTPAPVSGQGTAHARYNSPGTKKVVVTIDATGCKDSCEAVIVEEAVKPDLTCSGDTLTCDSTQASAKVISDPSTGVSYFWTPAPVSGQGTAHARYDSPGTKKVVVTIDATGCKDSCEAVIVEEAVKPDLTCSGDTLTCDSTQASAKVISDPSIGVSYFWTPAPVSGQETAHARYDSPGTKKVVVTIDATGCKDSCEAVIVEEAVKPDLTCSGDTLTCDSTLASAKVISDPSIGVSYFWTPAPVSGQETAHARYDSPGTKKVVVTIDATGCKDSCEAVIVEEAVKPDLTCSGDTLTCDSTQASAKVISDPSIGVSYFWTPAPVSGQETAHARYNSPGTKKVVVTIDATGCKDSCEAVIVEEAVKPDLTCSGDTLTCDSTLASAKVISDPSIGVSYFWTPAPVSGQETAHARYDSPGTKKVVVTIDATGCKDSCEAVIVEEAVKPDLTCSGDTLTCDSTQASAKVISDPSIGVSYFWTPAPVSGQETAHARYDSPGTKKVVVTIDATGCKDSCEAVIVEEAVKPDLTCSGDTLTCDSTQASAKVISDPSIGVSYFWTPAPVSGQETAHARYDSPGTKKVVVTIDATGCKDSCEAVIVEEAVKPDLTCSGDTLTCDSTQASAKVISDPSIGVSYFWTPAPVSGQETAHARYNSPGTKKVVVTIDVTGCKDSCLIVIAETITPPDCIITGNSVICEGSTTEFCATPGMVSYSWSGPEGFTANTHCTGQISTPGYYKVFIKDDNGCTNTCSTNLEVISCECLINVWIDTVDCVFPGGVAEVPVILSTDRPIGGFKLYIEYDPTVMNFLDIERGDMIDDFDGYWDEYEHTKRYDFQYFETRMLPCAQQCETYKIKIVGIADMPDGWITGPLEAGQGELIKLRFQVAKDANLQDLFLPVKWEFDYDFDLKAPSFSDPTGETLYVDEAWPGQTSQPNDNILPIVCFFDGGVKVCSDAYCWTGDLNLNEYPYEIADAVLYGNYFIFGDGVFDINYAMQILSSDVNKDGFYPSIADFVFLVRIILEDISPKHKLSPPTDMVNATLTAQGDVVKVISSSNTDIGAGLYVFKHSGEVKNLRLHTDMDVRYHDANGELRVLVYSFEGKSVPAGEVDLFSFQAKEVELIEVNAANFNGQALKSTITTKVLPTSFALMNNYPNPFNLNTNISFAIPEDCQLSLKLYNIAGQLVKAYENTYQAGNHTITWDGTNTRGDEVASGIYFYRLVAGDYTCTKKMVLMK